MTIRHTPRVALATIAVVAGAAFAVSGAGTSEREALNDAQRADGAAMAASRLFWPAAFEPVLAAAPSRENDRA